MKVKSIISILLHHILGEWRWHYFIDSYNFKRIKKQNEELSKLLQENIKYKDIHKGKRCFVLGNGPSIKNQDLSLLENEIVFTCNQITRNSDFEKIKTNYHFWADSRFFNLDENKPEDMELLDTMKNVNTYSNKPQCFFESNAFDFVKKFNLNKELNISFYKWGSSFCNNFDMRTDFTKPIHGFHTVVQYAIASAIYMGFKEIYIMGSEFTSIVTSVNIRLKNALKDDYAYELTKNEELRMNNSVNNTTFEQDLNSFYHVVKDYRILNEYCKKRGIKLVNCTPGGLIESLPRENYEDVMNEVIR